jgi:Domain of unknown function (DUF6265)
VTMRKILLSIVLSALSVPMAAFAFSDAHPMPEFLTGTWSHTDEKGWSEEYWTPLRADIMLGSSRSGTADTLTFWEQMRIQKEDDGAVVLWATSADQKPVRFEATVSGPNVVVFENPAHDYPQRIHYWREGKSLKAEISLIDGSKPVQFSFRLKKN